MYAQPRRCLFFTLCLPVGYSQVAGKVSSPHCPLAENTRFQYISTSTREIKKVSEIVSKACRRLWSPLPPSLVLHKPLNLTVRISPEGFLLALSLHSLDLSLVVLKRRMFPPDRIAPLPSMQENFGNLCRLCRAVHAFASNNHPDQHHALSTKEKNADSRCPLLFSHALHR